MKMENKNLWNGYSKEDKILIAHILDKYERYKKTGISESTFFLNPREVLLLENYLNYERIPYSIIKPSEECMMSVLVFGDDLSFITIYEGTTSSPISHSDILGTLFSIGYEKNMIGDIFVLENSFYLTNLTRLNSFLEEHLYQIKNQIVHLKKVKFMSLPENRFFKFSLIVGSHRLDSYVGLLSKKSRSQSLKIIQSGDVILNYQEVKNGSICLKKGDVLSIRHVGKFLIGDTLKNTKKQKEVVEIFKYQ